MKAVLLSLVPAAALLFAPSPASAQPRTSTFNSSIIPSQSLNVTPFNPTFSNPSFIYPASGYSVGIGNGYTYPAWNYNNGYSYTVPYYGGYYGGGYGGYYGGYGGYYGMRRNRWNW